MDNCRVLGARLHLLTAAVWGEGAFALSLQFLSLLIGLLHFSCNDLILKQVAL